MQRSTETDVCACRSTFEGNYNTTWPQVVKEVWELGSALSLNIFKFPGVHLPSSLRTFEVTCATYKSAM